MRNVLIIKNNDKSSNIYKYAKESFVTKEERYYNTLDDSEDEKTLKIMKDKFNNGKSKGLILIITYDVKKDNQIQEIFMGYIIEINDKYNVNYKMKVHLTNKYAERAIESIIEKIDLDISKDFEKMCYIAINNMDSLYGELMERIIAQENKISEHDYKECINILKGTYINFENDDKSYELSNLAQRDSDAIRIYDNSKIGKGRTEFQRDRERVVNCKAFRRMVDKAQIFSSDKGDYYRTRMTHSLEVNQIAKAIVFALKLNLDLTEAIALGHDLGHTPFGHQGERTLDDILYGKIKAGIAVSDNLLKERCFGGFKHNYQSAKILAELEEKYVEFSGLNVSVQVIEGVLKHTKMKKEIDINDFLKQPYLDGISFSDNPEKEVCATLEGQVVAIADEIAQRGHDVDDALTSRVISIEEFIDRLRINKCDNLMKKIENEIEQIDNTGRLLADKEELKIARIVSCIINYMIYETIEFSEKQMKKKGKEIITMKNTEKIIGFSDEMSEINSYLERVVQKKVICNYEVARADYNASQVVRTLFEKYYSNPRLLHSGTVHKIFIEMLKHDNELVSNSAINLNDGKIKMVNDEIEQITKRKFNTEEEKVILKYLKDKSIHGNDDLIIIFEKRKILIRCIVDYISGMTDGYAIEEFNKLR